MKTPFILIIVLIFLYSCQQSKVEKETKETITKTEKLQKVIESIEDNLSHEKEKIILLAEIRKIPFDTLNFILRDYYVAIDTVSSSDKNSKYLFQSSITKISDRYKISRSKIASLLFSYKYEMLTKEDIGESAVEDFKDNYEEEQTESDDRY